MENTPSKIAADILSAAMESKVIYLESTAPEGLAAAFTQIHAAVLEAAKQDKHHALFRAGS